MDDLEAFAERTQLVDPATLIVLLNERNEDDVVPAGHRLEDIQEVELISPERRIGKA
jgi:hypothetical protein